MKRSLAAVSLVVRDYDEAIAFYTNVMGFTLVEDEPMGNGKRWVVVAVGESGTRLVLARAANDLQASRIGNQTGGRVFLFLHTDDFDRDYNRWRSLGEQSGVTFLESPRDEPYGRVVVMQDLYGNKWDIIQPKN